jgi:hypothetical protein
MIHLEPGIWESLVVLGLIHLGSALLFVAAVLRAPHGGWRE